MVSKSARRSERVGAWPAWHRVHAGRALAFILAASIGFAFLLVFFAWPLLAILTRGLAGQAGVEALREVLGASRTWHILGQTLAMALAGTLFSILVGLPAAWALYRRTAPGASFMRAILHVPFVLPTVVVAVAFRAVLAPDGLYGFLQWDGTTYAVVAAMVFFNTSLIARTVGTLWASIGAEAEEAARTLGAGKARAFVTTTLPALLPSLASASALVFLFCSTSFALVQILGRPGYGTLETEIWVQTTTFLNLPVAGVFSLLQILVVLAALVMMNAANRKMRPLPLYASRTQRARGYEWIGIACVYGAIVCLIIVPLGALVHRAFTYEGRWSVENFRLLAEAGEGFTGGTTVLAALGHSLKIAGDATIIALVTGIIITVALTWKIPAEGLGIYRLARWVQTCLSGLTLAPLGVSAVTIGFGYFLSLTRPPTDLTGTHMLVPIAQALVALPLVVRLIAPLVGAIEPGMREAAATLGAHPLRRILTIDFPFLARGLGSSIGVAFAISLGEFGATSFLASPDYLTLPVLISRLLSRPGAHNYSMAIAGALLLAILTAGLMALSEYLLAPGARSRSRSNPYALAQRRAGRKEHYYA